MTNDDVKRISALLPKFIQMVENDLGEDEHVIEGKPLTYEEFQQIETLARKINICARFVDQSIFPSKEDLQ